MLHSQPYLQLFPYTTLFRSSSDMAKEAIRAGGHGYLVKSDAGGELLLAIATVLQGRHFASASLGSRVLFDRLDEGTPNHSSSDHARHTAEVGVGRQHEVAFYPNDASFVEGFVDFVKSALKSGNPIIVVATKSHRIGIRQRLLDEAMDIDAAIKRGSYIEADSIQTLSTVMENDMPVADQVSRVATNLITRAKIALGRPRIAMCGELAPVLLAQGKVEA